MRNLKRALSLTLASVMLLGMMVVGSSAAGYPDVAEEDNVEAIEVLQAVGVMEGDNNGNFNPDDYVTREQMAVIMSKLLNLDYNYYQGTNPFSDVPAWAAPYVAACAANGITSGIGGGMYGAGQNVNAVQAALMMLKALGYFQYQQDFGDDYVLATVKQATEVGLFNQIDSKAEQALTRNEVAQMALNALKSDLVRFTGDPGVEYTGSNGESWIGGYKAEYTPRTSTDPKYDRLIDNKHSSDIDRTGQYYVQLGEELYNGDLVQRYDSDIFERPSYTWTYKTVLVGTYVDREKFMEKYTGEVSGRTLYDLLNNITIREYVLETYVDGHPADNNATNYSSQYKYTGDKEYIDKEKDLVRSNTDAVGITADGVETEVYLDRTNKIITIVSMHTWLAKANNTYNEDRESASLKVYETSAAGKTKVVEPEDAPEVTGVTQDSYYLVKMSDKDSNNLEVVKIMEPEILSNSTITKFSQDGGAANEGKVTKLTTNGTQYKRNYVAYYDDDILDQYNDNLLSNATYNVYLDQNGFFVGVDLYEGDKNYVFITGYDMRNSNLSVQTATANGIFLDGTMENITVNVQDTNKNIDKLYTGNTPDSAYYMKWASHESDGVYLLNRWYTYTKTDSNVYTLKPCYNASNNNEILMFATNAPVASELKLKCDRVTLDGASSLLQGETMQYTNAKVNTSRAYGEDASVFIAVDTDDVSASIQKGSTRLSVTKAITDIKGVYTGVQDVELIAKSSDRVQGQYLNNGAASSTQAIGENVYTVYDKDHFIIGSVILGSTKGGVENYAYILDPVKSEEKKDDGYYYWEFECVYQGEIKTFQARTKYLSTIDKIKDNRYNIVELRFNDEYVVDCETIKSDEIYGDIFNEIKRPVNETENVYDVTLNNKTSWDRISGRAAINNGIGTLYLQGRTLYVLGKPASTPTADNDRGLALVRDAKAVVRQQDKNGKIKNQQFNSIEEAYSWLNDADDNRDNGLQFKGTISAVLNSQGVAEWVVFYNDNPWSANKGNGNNPIVDGEYRYMFSGSNLVILSDGVDAADVTDNDRLETAMEAMSKAGYTNLEIINNGTQIRGTKKGTYGSYTNTFTIQKADNAIVLNALASDFSVLTNATNTTAVSSDVTSDAISEAAVKKAVNDLVAKINKDNKEALGAQTISVKDGTINVGTLTNGTNASVGSAGSNGTYDTVTFTLVLGEEEKAMSLSTVQVKPAAYTKTDTDKATAAKNAIEALSGTSLVLDAQETPLTSDQIKAEIERRVRAAAVAADANAVVTFNWSVNPVPAVNGAAAGSLGTDKTVATTDYTVTVKVGDATVEVTEKAFTVKAMPYGKTAAGKAAYAAAVESSMNDTKDWTNPIVKKSIDTVYAGADSILLPKDIKFETIVDEATNTVTLKAPVMSVNLGTSDKNWSTLLGFSTADSADKVFMTCFGVPVPVGAKALVITNPLNGRQNKYDVSGESVSVQHWLTDVADGKGIEITFVLEWFDDVNTESGVAVPETATSLGKVTYTIDCTNVTCIPAP